MHLQPGSIGWIDLTVPEAGEVRAFYESVAGWTHQEVAMEGYSDFCMHPPGAEQPVAGICHARGINADLPPSWLIYIVVSDIEVSLANCRAGGGQVLRGPAEMGGGRVAVIRDPAGAVCALYQTLKHA